MTDTSPSSCCSPARGDAGTPCIPASVAPALPPRADPAAPVPPETMPRLPGGTFLTGTQDPDGFPADGEGPVREVRPSAFRVDAHAVSNRRFERFVTATGHVTDELLRERGDNFYHWMTSMYDIGAFDHDPSLSAFETGGTTWTPAAVPDNGDAP